MANTTNVIISGATVQTQDIATSNIRISTNMGVLTFAANDVLYDSSFTVPAGSAPNTASWPLAAQGALPNIVLYIKNTGGSSCTVNANYIGGTPPSQSMTLAPGGVFLYFNPLSTGSDGYNSLGFGSAGGTTLEILGAA